MRPVSKGPSPTVGHFAKYQDAKPELVSKLGQYCSYCERRVATNLAVEHIEPKGGPYADTELEKCWSNFLLACVNCNSCKNKKAVNFQQFIFPDRDNTFAAYVYENDGSITIVPTLDEPQQKIAQATLQLLGLDKPLQVYKDSNGELVALDRVGQRMEQIGKAQCALASFETSPDNEALQAMIIELAVTSGFFSIWMKVFDTYPDMKLRFIRAFKGTEASGCFDMTNANPIVPAPNPEQLPGGGKI